MLIKSRELGELKFFTLVFLLIAPIPAALTRDPYSTIRSLQMVIPLTIIISIGILEFLNKLRKKRLILNTIYLILAILIAYSLAKLYSSVIILNEYYRGSYWNYGWEEASNIIQNGLHKDLPIIVDNSRDEPYIQLAFFLKEDPVVYQKNNFEVPLSEYYTNLSRNKTKIISNIVTRPIDWEHDLLKEQYLIGDELAISLGQIKEHNLTLIKEIKYPDTRVAIRITKTNP